MDFKVRGLEFKSSRGQNNKKTLGGLGLGRGLGIGGSIGLGIGL